MRAQSAGIMINVVKTSPASPASFIASRAGIATMSQSADAELRQYGIRVFAVTAENPVAEVLALCLDEKSPR